MRKKAVEETVSGTSDSTLVAGAGAADHDRRAVGGGRGSLAMRTVSGGGRGGVDIPALGERRCVGSAVGIFG